MLPREYLRQALERVMGIEPMSHPLSMDPLVLQSVLTDQSQCYSARIEEDKGIEMRVL